MNHYHVAFPFQDDHMVVEFTSDMIANESMFGDDKAFKFKTDKNGEYVQTLYKEFKYNDKPYAVTFSYNSPRKFNVFEIVEKHNSETGGYHDEKLVASDIPWMLLKVTDDEGSIIYNIAEHI